jgi:predicted enzyme related to lactoylglutathione lyase
VSIDVLFAGVAVADFDAALAWYDRLLGRPADIVVKDDEVMWRITEGAWLYVVGDARHAGHALVALAVADLDEAIAQIESRGLARPPIETIAGAGRKASFTDLEGNTISFIQVERADH